MEKTDKKVASKPVAAPVAKPTSAPAPAADAPKIKYIVRIANTDLNGQKCTITALQKIRGIGHSLANAICNLTGTDKDAKVGTLPEAQWKKMEEVILNPAKIPTWMYNRQLDYETGKNLHAISGDLTFLVDMDIKRMKMIKARRGLRHAWNLPLRGQKTRSQHRKTKSKKSAASKRRPHKSASAGAGSGASK